MFELELRTKNTLPDSQKPVLRKKAKNRKPRAPPKVDDAPTSIPSKESLADPEPEHYKVSQRVYKVFSAPFHDPANPERPGEVAWQDFLFAMAAAKFQFEKLYGSVWKFTPTEFGWRRPINFHEPHPERKMTHAMARMHGRRLNKTYGWTAGKFVLE